MYFLLFSHSVVSDFFVTPWTSVSYTISWSFAQTHAHYPGEGNGNPLQYSCLENAMDRGAWLAPWGCKELDTTELLSLMTIDSVMPSNHLIFLHPLFLLPSIFLSVFSNESTLQIRWLKYRSFSFSISPSNEYSGLISFLIDWFNLLAVQRTLKSLQHHSLKTSILWCSAFFIVQLSHL